MKAGLLESHGHGRGTVYHLPGQSLPSADQAFSQSMVISLADKPPSDISLGHNDTGLGHNERHPMGWLVINGLSKPLIDNLPLLSDMIGTMLMEQAKKARALRKNTLKPLLDQSKLALAFPQTPTHSKQAYTTVNRR